MIPIANYSYVSFCYFSPKKIILGLCAIGRVTHLTCKILYMYCQEAKQDNHDAILIGLILNPAFVEFISVCN